MVNKCKCSDPSSGSIRRSGNTSATRHNVILVMMIGQLRSTCKIAYDQDQRGQYPRPKARIVIRAAWASRATIACSDPTAWASAVSPMTPINTSMIINSGKRSLIHTRLHYTDLSVGVCGYPIHVCHVGLELGGHVYQLTLTSLRVRLQDSNH